MMLSSPTGKMEIVTTTNRLRKTKMFQEAKTFPGNEDNPRK